MVKKKIVIIILGIFSLIGIIHGIVTASFNVFITWLLISIWLIFSFNVLNNIKRYRSFNSPYNTAFFIIGPLVVGIFYSIWGYFTGLMGENLIEGTNLYLSLWSIIFGSPYIIYGSISLYRCFRKYNVIYFGTKSIKARTMGYILSISVLLFIIVFWVSFYSVVDFYESLLIPLHFSIDLNLLLMFISTVVIIIVSGLLGARTQLPQLTREYIAQRVNRLNNLTSPKRSNVLSRNREHIRTTTRSSPTPTTRTITHTSRSISHSSRSTPTTRRQTISSRNKTTTKTAARKFITRSQNTINSRNLILYKPKAANLSIEDFKCIFCFKLPEFPKDNGRGIILCPKCRYPAHADEFKDWLRSSGLCSRCNAPIPASYKRNPKIIEVKNYLTAFKDYISRKK
jgi:hypothetical protein